MEVDQDENNAIGTRYAIRKREKKEKPLGSPRGLARQHNLGCFELVKLVDNQIKDKFKEKLLLAFRKERYVQDLVDLVSDFFRKVRV